MKKADLMIGDWVEFHSGYAKVTGITDEGVHFVDRFGGGIASGAEPVILTKEILDDNGMIHNVSKQSGDVFYLSIEGELAYVQVKCRFVHEVQHALRICGFIDGANNFKVS